MSENKDLDKRLSAQEAKSEGIMGDVNDMIADLLKNVLGEMQESELGGQMKGDGSGAAESGELESMQAPMEVSVIRKITEAMQKFIDNANLMLLHLEGGEEYNPGNDDFLENYLATADSILEIAAFSTKDNLTGLSNKHGFDGRLVLEWNRAIREKSPLSLIIFGIDGFDGATGDEAAQKKKDAVLTISQALLKTIKRSTDFIARINDDAFAALLPITNFEGAMVVAQRISDEIASLNIPVCKEGAPPAKACIGVCVQMSAQGELATDFFRKAMGLYRKAKEAPGTIVSE